MKINPSDPLVFFYTVGKRDERGYQPGGYVSATSRSDAIEKLCKEYTVVEAQVSLEFEMTYEDWAKDMARPYQGD